MEDQTDSQVTNDNQATVEDKLNQEAELEALKAKNEALLDNWKRAAADLENFKKRKAQELPELLAAAKEVAVIKLLPSLQSLEQVLKFAPTDEKFQGWVDGLKATILQLEKAMEELGLKKVKTIGEVFDPARHEAVGEEDGEEGKITQEVQPGFTLHDNVIIPAKVVVGKIRPTQPSPRQGLGE